MSPSGGGLRFLRPDRRGIDGALIDLEYQRVELLRFNLFDSSGTYPDYVRGRGGTAGPALRIWPEMRLPPDHPSFAAAGGSGEQLCAGELVRHRTLTGICNDIRNPLMGSTGMPFARNVEFEATFPDLGRTELARNRHGTRLGLLRPDPQVISRRLLGRVSSSARHVPRGARIARLLGRGALRLQDGVVPQRPGGVLDPVHDPRLVLPPHRRTKLARDDRHGVPDGAGRRRRAAADGRGRGPARMPRGGPGRGRGARPGLRSTARSPGRAATASPAPTAPRSTP